MIACKPSKLQGLGVNKTRFLFTFDTIQTLLLTMFALMQLEINLFCVIIQIL